MQILQLHLLSANPGKQLMFYRNILGIPVIEETAASFSLRIGQTTLKFTEDPSATPYHFAINIHPKHLEEALFQLKQQLTILPFQGKEIVDFVNWNARSFYFYDADHNIVEYIARNGIDFGAPAAKFSGKCLYEISEIGIATTDVGKLAAFLRENSALEIYDGDLSRFCAIGNEHGLFIIIDKEKKDWIPVNDKAFPSTFELTAETPSGLKKLVFNGTELYMANKA